MVWRHKRSDQASPPLAQHMSALHANPETKKGRHEAGPLEWGWWRRGGSNSRPRHCERRALPAELRPHDQADDTTASVDPKPAGPLAAGRTAVALRQTQHPGCNARPGHETPMTQTGPPGFPDGPAESWKVHGRSDAPSPIMPRISSCQQRAQHPGVLLVQLHAGGQQVGGGLVVGPTQIGRASCRERV